MPHKELRISARLSLQRAMLGAVKPNLRCVFLACAENTIHARFVYDDQFTDDDAEDVSVIETEVMADFDPKISVSCTAISVPSNKKVVWQDGEIAIFSRWESREYEA